MQIAEVQPVKNLPARDSVEVCVARSIAEVETLRESWQNWPGHRDSDIDFYLMILESYPEVVRPHVVALYRDGKLESIMVGRLERRRLAFGIGYIRLPRIPVRCLTFVYGAIHGDASAENAETLVRSISNSLENGEADLAFLEFVPLESPLYHLALKTPGMFRRDVLPAAQEHHLMAIPSGIDEVYRPMSAKHRKNLKREIKQLFGGDVQARVESYRYAWEIDRLFEDAEEIAKKTYQRGLGAGFADNADVRRRLGLAASKGWLRANLLYLGERPVAFWIGMLYNETFVSEYMGYDPDFRQSSPGMVLIIKVIEGFCEQANGDVVKELDFGLGHAEYKKALCSKTWQESPLYIFSPTFKGLMLKVIRTATRVVDASARKALTSTKVLPKLKRAWRNRLSNHKNAKPSPKGSAVSVPHSPVRPA